MCLAIPGKVKKVEGRKVWVSYVNNEVRQAMLAEENVIIGDWVQVQMGLVVRKLEEKEAQEALEGWKE